MDWRVKALVAMGAAAATNCDHCFGHQLAKCDELGIPRDEILEAVKIGRMVSRGAQRVMSKKAQEVLGESFLEVA